MHSKNRELEEQSAGAELECRRGEQVGAHVFSTELCRSPVGAELLIRASFL